MISTPLVNLQIFNLQSVMQQRPNSGSAAIGLLFKFKGEPALPLGKASVITGRTNTIEKWILLGLLWDRFTQSGRCRHHLAPT